MLLVGVAIALASGFVGWSIGDSTGDPEPVPVAAETTTEPTSEPSVTADSEPTSPDVVTKKSGSVDKLVAPPRSDRGHVVKAIGEPAIVPNEDTGEPMAEFTVEEIEVDPECTTGHDYAEDPENGHFIVITMSASVAPGFSAWLEAYGMYGGGMSFSESDFGLIDAEGLVVNEPATTTAMYCLKENEIIPNEVTDGQNARGKIVLDSPTTSGVLVYRPWYDSAGDGWEWKF